MAQASSHRMRRRAIGVALTALVAAVAVGATACGSGSSSGTASTAARQQTAHPAAAAS